MADKPTPDKPQTDVDRKTATFRDRFTPTALRAMGRRLGYRLYRLGGETVSVLLALGIAVLFFASGLLSRQSADLTSLRPNFEHWFSQGFDGARAELGDLELRWNPSDDTISFTVTDIIVYDQDDTIIQTLPKLKGTAPKSSVLRRRAALTDIEIVGGVVTWLQRDDGSITAGLGTPETVGRFGPVYRGQGDAPRAARLDWLNDFESVTLTDSRAHIVRESDGLDVILDVDSLSGARDGGSIHLNIAGHLSSEDRGNAGELSLAFQTDDNFETLFLSLKTDELVPKRIAPSDGRLSVFGAVDVPLNMEFEAEWGRDDGVRSAALDLVAGAGIIRLAGQDSVLNSGRFRGALKSGDQEMRVEALSVDADRLRLTGQGVIRDIGRWNDGNVGTSPKFDLALTQSWLDLRPIFERPLSVEKADAIGELDLDARTLTLDALTAQFEGFALAVSGKVATGSEGLKRVQLSGGTQTSMTAPDLLSLWPVNTASGARRWIDRSVLGGTLHNVRYRVDLDESFFANPMLTSERLQLDFDVQDGIVRYITTMDPIEETYGSGRVDGNRFGFVLASGRINDVDIVGGDINIPRLTPKGGDILISAEAKGPASSLLRLINQPPFGYLDRYGVEADGFGGTANVTVNVKRPLLEFFDPDRVEYSVDGTFTDASAPFSLGGFKVYDADVTVRAGKEGLFVEGPVNLGPWRANLSWAERYGQNGEPTRYKVSGLMNRKTLDGFGVGFREFFGGDIDVDIEASGKGLEIAEAIVDVGLDQAEITFGDIWSKSKGDIGRIRATLARGDEGFSIPKLTMQAPGLDLGGSIQLRAGMALQEARLDTAKIDGLIDGRLVLSRDDIANRLALDASGDRLDISAFVAQALARAGGETNNIPLSFDAAFDEIILSPGYALEQGTMSYRHNGDAVEQLSLQGARDSGPLRVQLEQIELGSREATLIVPDVSEAASKILGLNATQGGALTIKASLPETGVVGAVIGQAVATDLTVQNAPFLAQILSLASLTGIVDTLSGGGLSFDELVFDFALQDRILSVRDAKMRGPAIGMTGEGDIGLDDKTVDFSGTVVPAYTANSLLGDIPLIGDLLIGKDGEGVFAVTYAVKGPYSSALISINPLSALTPGFIRGIFRESRDELPESVIKDIEAVRPPEVESRD
ncbi:MAG: YhdP family protein [Litorimonas sp.]